MKEKDILLCERCALDHIDLEFYPLTNPQNHWDYYAICPTNGQPILRDIRDRGAPPARHEIRLNRADFRAIESGKKEFLTIFDDADYTVRDKLTIREWNAAQERYTGNRMRKVIKYKRGGEDQEGIESGYCVLGLEDA